MVSEFTSIIVLLLFMPKKIKINKEDIKPQKKNIQNILAISIPNTNTRLIGNIGYFLEPILLTSSMITAGYNINFITQEYGIIEGYSMPLLLLPGFFTGAISNSLLPVISKAFSNKKYQYIKNKLKQAIMISLSIGLPVTLILFLFPDFFLKLIYGISYGSNYLRVLAIPFLFYYIELPLAASMQAMNMSKEVMFDNILGIVLKTILLYTLSLLHIGMYGFIIASCTNIIVVTISHYIHIKKKLN
jgi:stage V sporulation protein B